MNPRGNSSECSSPGMGYSPFSQCLGDFSCPLPSSFLPSLYSQMYLKPDDFNVISLI